MSSQLADFVQGCLKGSSSVSIGQGLFSSQEVVEQDSSSFSSYFL